MVVLRKKCGLRNADCGMRNPDVNLGLAAQAKICPRFALLSIPHSAIRIPQSPARISSIHDQIAASEIAAGIRREKDDSGGYFSWFANSPHRREVEPKLVPIVLRHTCFGHFGTDISR